MPAFIPLGPLKILLHAEHGELNHAVFASSWPLDHTNAILLTNHDNKSGKWAPQTMILHELSFRWTKIIFKMSNQFLYTEISNMFLLFFISENILHIQFSHMFSSFIISRNQNLQMAKKGLIHDPLYIKLLLKTQRTSRVNLHTNSEHKCIFCQREVISV